MKKKTKKKSVNQKQPNYLISHCHIGSKMDFGDNSESLRLVAQGLLNLTELFKNGNSNIIFGNTTNEDS